MSSLTRHAGVTRAACSALVALAALTAGLAWSQQAPPESVVDEADAVDIAATTLSVDAETREARFSGDVVVRRGDWVLSCQTLIATYQDDGQLAGARVEGPVELTGPGLWAEAEQGARYLGPPDERIVLEGEAVVRRGQSQLRAERVEVELATGQIEMHGVRGRLVVPAAEPDDADDAP